MRQHLSSPNPVRPQFRAFVPENLFKSGIVNREVVVENGVIISNEVTHGFFCHRFYRWNFADSGRIVNLRPLFESPGLSLGSCSCMQQQTPEDAKPGCGRGGHLSLIHI